jgi:hypothetical protein
MIDSLFLQIPPVWASPALLSPAPAALGGLGLAQPAPPPGSTSASMLVAAMSLRRGQPNGPTNDQEVEDVIYDALELVPGASEVEVRCESGRVTLSGAVPHKRLKRDIGEIAWSIPALSDVANNITIASRRRARSFARESESVSPNASRKQA